MLTGTQPSKNYQTQLWKSGASNPPARAAINLKKIATDYRAPLEHANDEATQPRHILPTIAGADAAAVFIRRVVQDVVTAILDVPLPTVDLQRPLRAGLLRRTTGNAVGDFGGRLPGLLKEGTNSPWLPGYRG